MSAAAAAQVAMPARAAESCHFYRVDDEGVVWPCYEVPYADKKRVGQMRRANLGDAKKNAWLGSFSHAWTLRSNKAVERWAQGCVALAALTSPRRSEYEAGTLDEEAFLASVFEDAEAERTLAADEGTAIHTASEQALRGEPYDPRWEPQVRALLARMTEVASLDTWRTDVHFARPDLGYGGRIDALSGVFLADIKSSKPWVGKAPCWDSWKPQLAAYDLGIGGGYGTASQHRLLSFVVSRGPDARCEVLHYTDAEHAHAEREWMLLLRLYLHVTGLGAALRVSP